MAREIESVHEFTHKSHKFGLPKDITVLRCDDGAVYEFIRPDGEPNHRLARRFQPDGELSTSSGVLPGAVKELAEDLFGENRWVK